MGRISLNLSLALAILALAVSPVATAQSGLRGKQTGAVLPQAASTPSQPSSASGMPAAEPKDVEGILAAQNEARRRLNLAPLSWSAELTARAVTTAAAAAANTCSKGTTEKIGDATGAAVYWAAGLPRNSSSFSVQSITPSFLVSEWQAGRADYDRDTGVCRRAGECQSWARMVAPAAREVGCARVICPSQAQVWACQYDTSKAAPSKAPPDLRRRNAD